MFRTLSREEIANALTHGVGAVLSLVGLCVLTYRSLWYQDVGHTVAVCVYGISLLSVYTSSTLHHAVTSRRMKHIYLLADHSCIYLLIAGTYTPFMLTVLKGATGVTVLCTVWALGITGIVSKTALRIRSDVVSIPFYLAMGWLIVFAIRPFASLIDVNGLLLLLAGGLCYSVGIFFFLARFMYGHAIWHVFVLAGSALHYFSVLFYATPH